MQNQIEQWIDQRVPDDALVSHIQVWIETDSSWDLYYSHVTTNVVDEFTIDPDDEPIYIVGRNTPVSDVLYLIPEEQLSRTEPATMEIECLGDPSYSSQRETEYRLERAYSGQVDAFGAERSSVRVEWWIDESDRPKSSAEIEATIHQHLLEQCDLDLSSHLDYRGNLIVVLEDKRIKFRPTESPEIEIDEALFFDDLDIILQWQEYGDTIWSDSLGADQFKVRNQSTKSGELAITMIVGDDEYTVSANEFYQPDTVLSPGASEVCIKIVHDGVTLDWNEYPLIRIISGNVQLGISGDESGPPKLYHKSPTDQPGTSFTTGEHIWDTRRLAFGTRTGNRGWCTSNDEITVESALSTIKSEFGSVVKIVDPYIAEDRIIELVDSIEKSTDMWIITSQPIDGATLTTKLQQWNTTDRKVELLRVMDANGSSKKSPLHDRMILTDGTNGHPQAWVLGTSFNSLDLNTSVITEVPLRVTNQLDIEFNSWWYEPIEERYSSTNCRKEFQEHADYA